MQDYLSAFDTNTYESYEEASDRTKDILELEFYESGEEASKVSFNLYNLRSVSRLLLSFFYICVYSFGPIILIISALILLTKSFASDIFVTSFLFMLIALLFIFYPRLLSQIPHSKPGLYFARTTSNINIIKSCPLLFSEYNSPGKLSKSSQFTSWMFTGDLRTLLPFLLNNPPNQKYKRRWVRVPLCHGPRDNIVDSDAGGTYEAVAVDCAASMSGTLERNLLILAGLTGGSEEGYCLDLVDTATRQGWNCFIMLGRGLAGSACLSSALFHGARTSDLRTVAALLKKLLPSTSRLMTVGISMGGIIVSNALCRGELDDLVDGGVSISGSDDNVRNARYSHSRKVWQPILAHGLKTSFALPPILFRKLRKPLGANAAEIIVNLRDVVEFDSVVVTALHGFRDVAHYYGDMNVSPDMVSAGLRCPLLALHALDDPIIHADSIATAELCPSDNSRPLSEHMFTLMTEVGGHVGWPTGWLFWRRRWAFQNNIVLEFLSAVLDRSVIDK